MLSHVYLKKKNSKLSQQELNLSVFWSFIQLWCSSTELWLTCVSWAIKLSSYDNCCAYCWVCMLKGEKFTVRVKWQNKWVKDVNIILDCHMHSWLCGIVLSCSQNHPCLPFSSCDFIFREGRTPSLAHPCVKNLLTNKRQWMSMKATLLLVVSMCGNATFTGLEFEGEKAGYSVVFYSF